MPSNEGGDSSPLRALPDRQEASSLLRGVAESLCSLEYRPWSFGDSVGFEGMVAASVALGDASFAGFARGFARAWAARRRPFAEADCTAPGFAMVEIARRSDDARLLEALVDLAEHLASRRRIGGAFVTFERTPLQHPFGPVPLRASEVELLVEQPAGVFVDCLHFDPPFFTALGSVTGDQRWTGLGVEQALSYVELLQAPSGLFDHFVLERQPRPFGPRWGRGQGWALLGLLDVLGQLPGGHSGRAELASACERLIAALLPYQRPDGHFDAVLGEAGSGLETSTAAFVACGISRARRLGLADREAEEVGRRALEAAVGSTRGFALEGVSIAVGSCTEPTHYSYVPRGHVVPWGQGPLALALAAHLGAGGEEPTDWVHGGIGDGPGPDRGGAPLAGGGPGGG